MFRQQRHTREVYLAIALKAGAPQCRHRGHRIGRAGQLAGECILGAAVDDPLRVAGLPTADGIALQ